MKHIHAAPHQLESCRVAVQKLCKRERARASPPPLPPGQPKQANASQLASRRFSPRHPPRSVLARKRNFKYQSTKPRYCSSVTPRVARALTRKSRKQCVQKKGNLWWVICAVIRQRPNQMSHCVSTCSPRRRLLNLRVVLSCVSSTPLFLHSHIRQETGELVFQIFLS